MTEFFQDAHGRVGKTQYKCMMCYGTGVESYGETCVTCVTCGGFGWVCEDEEFTPEERDELDKWVFD